ncbi:MAG TPA: N-acetylmuramoyl-L-alanine amidase [Pseudogracilibacillus sp.]|nr:N-acetylmuramoyl-L-alanine amidase [Pseudogracilibacillus sp.]
MNVIDRRKIAIGGNSRRSVKQITHIAIHYSATAVGNSKSFETYWRQGRNWTTGGYHEVVLRDGDVELNYDPTVITNGVLGYNVQTYHICYVGDGLPTNAQLKMLRSRVERAYKRFGIKRGNIKGHREFPNAKTSCPKLDVQSAIVNRLGNNTIQRIVRTITPAKKPKMTGKTKAIQTWLNEYSFNQIKIDDKYGPETHRALVKVYQYELNKQFGRHLVIDGIPGPKTDAAYVTIRKGARGNLTKTVQAFLFFKRYTLAVDSIFGPITEEMVRRFQRDRSLRADGIVGRETLRPLIRFM